MKKKENEAIKAHQSFAVAGILIFLALTFASHFRNWEFPVQDAEAAPSKIELFYYHLETAKALKEEIEYHLRELKRLGAELSVSSGESGEEI